VIKLKGAQVKSIKNLVGILAVLALVVGGVYGIQQINAGENCSAHAKTRATATASDATVETANATVTTANTKAGCCAAKAGTITAEHATAGAQCTYNAKTASAQCTGGDKAYASGELLTAEAAFAKLAHCGIDCRKVDAQVLAAKLAGSQCGSYTQEQWASMIKSAQALEAKQADVIFASATSEKPCAGDACPMKKVAADLAAAESEEKKSSAN
jgi:hypothetical protein